jgi:hypothetical protein
MSILLPYWVSIISYRDVKVWKLAVFQLLTPEDSDLRNVGAVPFYQITRSLSNQMKLHFLFS